METGVGWVCTVICSSNADLTGYALGTTHVPMAMHDADCRQRSSSLCILPMHEIMRLCHIWKSCEHVAALAWVGVIEWGYVVGDSAHVLKGPAHVECKHRIATDIAGCA